MSLHPVRRPHFRLTFSLPRLVRVFLVALLLAGFVLGAESGIARAATRILPATASSSTSHSGGNAGSVTAGSSLPSNFVLPHVASPTNPYDTGLGVLPFYTYVKHPLNTCACGKKELMVNVATGNLVLHSVEMQIHGTGEDLDLDAYYNSQPNSNAYPEMGTNWNLSLGRQVYLDESHLSSYVILYGSSNYDTYFAHNGDGTFTSPPAINATLTDNHNNTYTLTYHSTGQKWLFGSNGSLSSITDKNGNSITVSESGSLTASFTDTQGRIVTVGHNSSNLISGLTDSTGRSTTYNYNNGTLTSSTDLLGKPTGYTYTGTDITTVIDARDNSTTIAYDGNHRVTSITDPLGGITKFTYTSGTTVVTDANGHASTYTYDSNFKVTSTKDALGHTSSTAFDATNYNVTSTTDALQNTNVFGFDSKNNLQSVTDGNGNQSKATYTNSTFQYYPDTTTDAQGNTTTYSYDGAGNVSKTSDPLSTQNTETYSYNSNGTIAKVTDADGNSTSYGYDSKGNLTSVTPPSPLGKQTLTPDALSRVGQEVDGNGTTITLQYNNLDRLVNVAYNGHSPTRYTYDDNGNVLTLEDTTGTTSFTYDALNRLTVKKLPDGTSLTYGYDKVGNLTSYSDAGGTVTYGYNAVNLLTSLTEPSGAKTTYGYDNANRRTSMTLPSSTGITVTYGYDNAGHTLSIKALRGTTQLLYLTYTYTKTLKTKATYNDDTSLNYIYGYSYDALNRLTGASGLRGTSTSYGYDGAGNRTSSVSHGITTTYSYNAADELVSSLTNGTTTSYTYDGNGNQLTGAGRTFSINEKNQITGVTTGSSNDSYTYSGLDQTDRVQYNGASTVYSSLGLSVDGAGSSSATYYTRTNQGQLVNERTTSGTYYYLMDDLGSVLKVVDSSGNVKNSYYYDPYGNSLNKSETVTNPWQYASGYYDANTGLYKFGTRYYDPQTGRWTQKDSQGGGYVYAGNNPVSEVDPSGRFPVFLALAILGCIGGAIGSLAALAFSSGGQPPSTNATIKTLIAGCVSGALISVAATYFFAEGAVALTIETSGNALIVPAAADAIFGIIYAALNNAFPG